MRVIRKSEYGLFPLFPLYTPQYCPVSIYEWLFILFFLVAYIQFLTLSVLGRFIVLIDDARLDLLDTYRHLYGILFARGESKAEAAESRS